LPEQKNLAAKNHAINLRLIVSMSRDHDLFTASLNTQAPAVRQNIHVTNEAQLKGTIRWQFQNRRPVTHYQVSELFVL
jgi:hypothetical protein